MGTIKENYEMMFTSYPDLVDINQLKEMLGIGITLAYRLVQKKDFSAWKKGMRFMRNPFFLKFFTEYEKTLDCKPCQQFIIVVTIPGKEKEWSV